MKKFLTFFVLAGVLIAAVWFYHKKTAVGAPAETSDQPTARVETIPLKMQPIAQTLEAYGVVASGPSGEQVVSAAFDCIVRRVKVVPGARVLAGEVLLEIQPNPETQLQVESARSTLAAAVKSLAGAKERFDLKLATGEELRTAEQAELEARQKISSFEARGLAGDGRVLSPVSGVVTKLEISPGSSVASGVALAVIAADAGMEARLSVEVSDAAKIVPGQAVVLRSAHRSDSAPIVSAVRLTGQSLDAASGTVEVRVPVSAGAALLIGEHVSASIELLKKNALVVPRLAVLPDEGKQVLYTNRDGRAVRHEVAVGIVAGDWVEVSGGDLREGDKVVTLGNYELSPGMTVQEGTEKEKGEDAKP